MKRLVKKEIESGNYTSNILNESKCIKLLKSNENFIHYFKQLEDDTYLYQIIEFVDGYDMETFLDEDVAAGKLSLVNDKLVVRMLIRKSLESLWFLN